MTAISVATVTLGLLVNSMAAFARSRLQFRGQKAILGVILATLIVPFVAFQKAFINSIASSGVKG